MNPQAEKFETLYQEIQQSFDKQTVAQDEFRQVMKQKVIEGVNHFGEQCGSYYDESLFDQLIQMSQDQYGNVDLQNFVSGYIEIEDTLTFRIQVINDRAKELKVGKQQLKEQMRIGNPLHPLYFPIENKQTKQNAQNSHLLVQILDATDVEPTRNQSHVNTYVRVQFEQQQFETNKIQSSNPNWRESFDIQIRECSNSSKQRLVLTVLDVNRGEGNEYYGQLVFSVDELKGPGVKEINQNLIRQDQVKLKTKMHVSLKYIHSKESIYKQEEKKIDEEIKQLGMEMKENEQALVCLQKVFGNCQSIPIAGKYLTQTGGQLHSFLEIHPYEQNFLETIDPWISNWGKLFLQFTFVLLLLEFVVSLQKNVMIDFTLIGALLILYMFESMTHNYMRVIFILFAFQFMNEAIWLFIYAREWASSVELSKGEVHVRQFINIFAYIGFLVRIPFTIIVWRFSLKWEELGDTILEKLDLLEQLD